ncbi:CbtB domain-containing protein [Azospirillum thermophilum]|uniref:Cobalt transporter subunit n=1 Tax=Azospirillum thermophilum TaxID=2202148 RepID=A0A2S2CKL7_9PROT|nr:CbtB domain-containing protein [Azospirillum thermophilum]AWK84857.1 cobalt transporter subunit [Azospirillum thermophilum]
MTMLNSAIRSGAASSVQTVAAAFGAFLLGAFILFGVGFAQPQAIHDAAHDGRHSFAFPCH